MKMTKGCMTLVACLGTFVLAHDQKQSCLIPFDKHGYPCIQSAEQAARTFPLTVVEVQRYAELAKGVVEKGLAEITSIPADQHTKDTLLGGIDRMIAQVNPYISTCYIISAVHPDPMVRQAAESAKIALTQFLTEQIAYNKKLYQLQCSFLERSSQADELGTVDRYFLEKNITWGKHVGLHLDDGVRTKAVALENRCTELAIVFQRQIDEPRSIEVTEDELAGIPDDIKKTWKRNGDRVVLMMDYPTNDVVMAHCSNGQTRQTYLKEYFKRGYPKNEGTLLELVQKRHELAVLLGHESFASFDLALQMIETPARAWAFERELQSRALPAAWKDFKTITLDLPEGVSLRADGTMEYWDVPFTLAYFKQKYFAIDELIFAEYFPMEKTVAGLMQVYEQFFDLIIEMVPTAQVWHEDVRLLCVKDKKDGAVLGYVFLDMFPRENKYGHAAVFPSIRGVTYADGTRTTAVSTMVCNFTKPTAEKPSLLKYHEVVTFFHEFGHALHNILGATAYYSHSGTQVKQDFVELPSQMLENWMENREILKLVSGHYKTGQPLPDELITNRLKLLKFGQGMWVVDQLLLGMFSLELLDGKNNMPPDVLWQKYAEENKPFFHLDSEAHRPCSFGHIANYAAKYYGYLWTEALGADVFGQIKKEGLLNPVVGKKYVDAILSHGGSRDPNDLLRDYLGREPNLDAFFRKMEF